MMRSFLLLMSLLLAAAGVALRPDPDRAAESLARVREAAAQGDAQAMFRLGLLYDRGYDTIRPDTTRANEFYARAAEGGYAPAMGLLGYRLIRGEGIEADSLRGLAMLRRGAEAGDVRAQANLGWVLTFGSDSPADHTKGVANLRRAADAGFPVAMASLGRAAEAGIAMKVDPARAAELYDSALRRGFAPAAEPLWRLRNEAYSNLSADSLLQLGRMYYLGAAPQLGVALLEMSAGGGSPAALALLGDAAAKGRGRSYSHSEAVRYYYRAARGGNAPAQFILAELLESFPDALDDVVDDDRDEGYATTDDAAPAPHADAAYWRYRARIGGVVSAAAAEQLLYSGQRQK